MSDDVKGNKVTLNLGSGVGGNLAAIALDMSTVFIGAGKGPEPTSGINKDKTELTFDLDCERTGSSDVAKQFIELCGDPGDGTRMMATTRASDYSGPDPGPIPAVLNFCFGFDITFENGAKGKIYLGQGHFSGWGSNAHDSVNNWWIGSPNMSLLCWDSVERRSQLTFTSGSGQTASIFISAHPDEGPPGKYSKLLQGDSWATDVFDVEAV